MSGSLEPQPDSSAGPSILEGNSAALLNDLITFSDDEEGTKSVGKSVSTEEETSSVQEKEESSLGAKEEEFSVEESSEESIQESNKSSEVLLIDLGEDQSDVPEEPDVVWPCVIWRTPTQEIISDSNFNRKRLQQVVSCLRNCLGFGPKLRKKSFHNAMSHLQN